MSQQSQRVYDDRGILYVAFQRLPGEENNPLYLSSQAQITDNFPKTQGFGLTRLPVAGELLKVDRFLWRVEHVLHHPANSPVDPDDLFPDEPSIVATVQVCFHGALG